MVEINFEYKIKKVTKLLQALAMWLKNSLGQQKQNKSNIRKINERGRAPFLVCTRLFKLIKKQIYLLDQPQTGTKKIW